MARSRADFFLFKKRNQSEKTSVRSGRIVRQETQTARSGGSPSIRIMTIETRTTKQDGHTHTQTHNGSMIQRAPSEVARHWSRDGSVREEDVAVDAVAASSTQTAVSLPSCWATPLVCSLTGDGGRLPLSTTSAASVASARFRFSVLARSGPSLPSFSLTISPGFSSSMRACDSPSPTVRRRPKKRRRRQVGDSAPHPHPHPHTHTSTKRKAATADNSGRSARPRGRGGGGDSKSNKTKQTKKTRF